MDSARPAVAPLKFSSKAARAVEQPISYLISVAMANPKLINLAAGLVDSETLPTEIAAEVASKVLSSTPSARAALQYDTTLGLAPLRAAMLEHLAKLDGVAPAEMALTADQIVITTGSQQALYLVADVLVDPGDIVIAANPCYFVFAAALTSLGARVLTVGMDQDGLNVDAVEAMLEQIDARGELNRVKLIYTTTYFQNPTGLTLSLPRRRRLMQIVERYAPRQRIIILEDAAYRELRYDGPPLPSIKSMDPHNRHTVLACTFSKPFAPGFKTGYTAMPSDLLDSVLVQKGNHDFGSSSLNQHLLLEAMRGGHYAKQVKTLCESYKAKRDVMLAALEKHMPPSGGFTWTRPNGGLYIWLTAPLGLDTTRSGRLFNECLKQGVLYVPGDYCFQPESGSTVPTNHMRLSFGQVAIERIEPGIERLAAAHKSIETTKGETTKGDVAILQRATSPLDREQAVHVDANGGGRA
jgi:2-aminoadipate transaminase